MAKARIVVASERSEGARARILRVALELFSAKGFDGCGLRELAAAARVNHSLVLYHFGSLEGLWKEVVGELVEEFRRRVQQRLAGLSAVDPVTRLRIAAEDFIRFSIEKPELHRIMTLEGRRSTGRLTWLVETYLKPMFEETAAVIGRGQAEGTVRRFDPRLLYYAFICLAATPGAYAHEIEAVTGRHTRDEATVVELMAMVSALLFTADPQPAAKSRTKARKHK